MLKLTILTATVIAGLSFSDASQAGNFSGITTTPPTTLKAIPNCPGGSVWDGTKCALHIHFPLNNGSQQVACTRHHQMHCTDSPES